MAVEKCVLGESAHDVGAANGSDIAEKLKLACAV
jgi:hypothetical protein